MTFDSQRGGPGEVTFSELKDWRAHSNRGIQHYSGIAVYRKSFDLPALAGDETLVLDLGDMFEMARVTINGRQRGIVWALRIGSRFRVT